MSDRLEPEIVQLIEDIVARRVREEMAERAQLVTTDQFAEAMERIDRRFEESIKRFEQVDRHFEEVDRHFEEVDRHFEQVDRHFEQVDRHFEEVNQRFDQVEETLIDVSRTVNDIKRQLGAPFEQFSRNIVSRILEGEGYERVSLPRQHFTDSEHVVFPETEDVEVDGFSADPPVIIEVTSILRNDGKVQNFLRKKDLVESLFGQPFRGFFVASGHELERQVLADLTVLLINSRCELLNL